jgi:alpha-beta hydrolase superfamily lysophospholipase
LGYSIEFLRTIQELEENDPLDLNLPLLVMISSNDQVVTGNQVLMDHTKHPDKQLKDYQGGRHNLLQEPLLKEQVTYDILQWLHARVK